MICPECKVKINKSKLVKKNNNGVIFYYDKSKEKNIKDILKYHCFIGVYIICPKCETLIS